MSGHNKWAKVKHVKGKLDAIRGRLFTKIIKEITIAARNGGGDPDSNPKLRAAIQIAKDANMPRDNVDRAVKKGTGELEGVSYEEITYEGYAPGGVAVLVRTLTDNKNRTVAEVQKIFSKGGGNMGTPGCVSFMFENKGFFFLSQEDNPKATEDSLMEIVLDTGCEDLKTLDDGFEIYCNPSAFLDIRPKLEEKGLKISEAQVSMIPKTTVKVAGNDAPKLLRLIDQFEEHDDVQNVYHNGDIDDADLEAAAAE
ncbi:MAG TPA: YebC/PmpR family DNA-binding transcriptional regulator [Candidatus Ozemobacteraceae bacterium]|nr:YebC/PmpR family DNA-binding transcriptional regulator [Candidatus Ozemobacteraceae bacterium]